MLIRELLCGSHRYNDFKRGLPLISPTMLSQRLHSLQDRGLAERRLSADNKSWEYHLTAAGQELEATVMGLGAWGARWMRSQMSDDDLSVELLMWDMRRTINDKAMPAGRNVLHFEFPDLDEIYKHWWMLAEHGEIDLCVDNPGYEPDITFTCDLKTLTQLWLGDVHLSEARKSGKLDIRGNSGLTRDISSWLVLSGFADIKSGYASA